jgi:AbrB family looped-hinge helix DNA binding protein
MELSKVSSKGQITIPIGIRKKLNLRGGDKVLFLEDKEKIILKNSSLVVLKEIQESMRDEIGKSSLYSEDDVKKVVKDVRRDIWEKKYENND